MNHELGLMFKEWVKKVPAINRLYNNTKRLTIWVRNHGDILVLFESLVKMQYPNDKRIWSIQHNQLRPYVD